MRNDVTRVVKCFLRYLANRAGTPIFDLKNNHLENCPCVVRGTTHSNDYRTPIYVCRVSTAKRKILFYLFEPSFTSMDVVSRPTSN